MQNTITLHLPNTVVSRCKSVLFIFTFLILSATGFAQSTTINITVIKAPCNKDGILVAQTSGVTGSYTLNWYINGTSVTHTVIGPTDTLINYGGGPVYVSGYNNGWQGYGSINGVSPFNYHVTCTPVICPAKLGSAKVTITGGKAPYIVQWSLVGQSSVVATGDSVNMPQGSYSVLITDANGCAYGSFAQYDSITINYITPIQFNTNVTTANCTNGTASVSNVTGGITPYAYLWSNGANTPGISNLVQGNYSVTITDAQGCLGINSYIYVYQAYQMSALITPTNATCLQNNGSAIAFGQGGQAPYQYLWSTGQRTQSVSGLTGSSTYYSVNVTDAKGCVGSGAVNIISTTPITVTYSSTASSCTSATGTATLNISGGASPYNITWNTYPIQKTATATGLMPGLYSFEVTDANGCVRSGSVYVPPISIVSAYTSENDAVCTQSNGIAAAIVTSGATPISYKWSNGATSPSISGLAAGFYAVTITDAQSCAVYKYVNVNTASPINLSFNSSQASCIYSNDGNISALVSGGTAPYQYSWSAGQTTATATGLLQGDYYAYVTDAAGCTQWGHSYVGYDPNNNSCYCTIAGTVYNDLNSNCTLDGGEPGIQNIMVHLSNFGYTFTDANGNYSFQVPSGSYTLSEDVEYYYPLASCQNNSIPVTVTASSGCTSTYNFANVINPIHDVSILTTSYCPPPIPGYTYTQRLIVQNNGTITENGIHASYGDDGQLVLNSFNPALFAGAGADYYKVNSGFPSLAPGASQEIDASYGVPANIPIGTSVVYNDTVAWDTIPNWVNDYSPWNNVSAYQNYVVGSFDPNYKEVTPKGTGVQGYITTADSMLTYTIHFQNTGNYPAQKVVVVDTLDPHLDITTLRPGYSNYSYSTSVTEGGVLKFTFNNINLPDSAGNNQLSIGMVTYTIRQKPNNTPGTQIKSPANIYFDYNAPVKTNTTLNTLASPNGVKTAGAPGPQLFIFPNPASAGKVNLLVNTYESDANATVTIYNLVGQQVQGNNASLVKGRNLLSEDVSALPAGIYFVKVQEGNNSLTRKLTLVK